MSNQESQPTGAASNNEAAAAPRASVCSNAFDVWFVHYAECSDVAQHIALCKRLRVREIPQNGDRVYIEGWDGGGLPQLISLGATWHESEGEMIPVVTLNDEDQQANEATLQQWRDQGWVAGEPWELF